MSGRARSRAILAGAGAVASVALAGCGGVAPSVLEVRVADRDATAFPVGEGRAVTVAHVLRAGQPVFVGGRRARVLRVDRRLDVALLDVAGIRGTARRAAASAGESATVRAVGRDVRATVRRTISAHIGGQVRPALELTADVMPGDSGAPVVDGDGRVIGMVFAQASDAEPLTYALDARALGPLLRR